MSGVRNDFEAPFVLADRCGAFTADPDEPGICANCGWLLDEHPEPEPLSRPVAA
jgi:hypothetical protein